MFCFVFVLICLKTVLFELDGIKAILSGFTRVAASIIATVGMDQVEAVAQLRARAVRCDVVWISCIMFGWYFLLFTNECAMILYLN